MLDVKALLTKILDAINGLQSKKFVTYNGGTEMKLYMVARTVSSNSSGLINITDLGANSSNCSGLQVMCTTSNYRVSNPILWSNFNYYVTLFNWNNSTVVANKSVNIIVTWFQGV